MKIFICCHIFSILFCFCFLFYFFLEKIKFPENYPTGSLLGCVTVVDVLSQEQYRKMYPEGESESPYVFICENCYTLPIKFPIQGKHKICK